MLGFFLIYIHIHLCCFPFIYIYNFPFIHLYTLILFLLPNLFSYSELVFLNALFCFKKYTTCIALSSLIDHCKNHQVSPIVKKNNNNNNKTKLTFTDFRISNTFPQSSVGDSSKLLQTSVTCARVC